MWPYEKRTEDIFLQFSFLLSLNSSSRKMIFYIIFPLERLLDEPHETNIKKAKKHNAYTLHDGNRVVIIISCRSITRVLCYSGHVFSAITWTILTAWWLAWVVRSNYIWMLTAPFLHMPLKARSCGLVKFWVSDEAWLMWYHHKYIFFFPCILQDLLT